MSGFEKMHFKMYILTSLILQLSQGHGTCEDTLIRILVSRSEIDLKKILDEYHAMYNTRLQEDIVVWPHDHDVFTFPPTHQKKLNMISWYM